VARNFPHWLKAYCDFTATSEAPLDFHFWTGVSTVAAVLRRRVWKDELLFKWTPNFYIVFVGPAGIVTKSTTLNIGYQLLRAVPNISFGPDSMTWHGLARRFEAAVEYANYKDPLGKDHKILMSPLTCSISELGTFLRPDDKGLVSFLTDVWDGKERPFDHVTKDSGALKIENPWLNIIGATTPEWMQDNFPAGDRLQDRLRLRRNQAAPDRISIAGSEASGLSCDRTEADRRSGRNVETRRPLRSDRGRLQMG
jgi:hypothetical protein